MMQLNRSFLFAPGNHDRKVAKVFETGADNVILDLEDAVAAAEKIRTRDLVRAALSSPRSCRAFVRVNALETDLTFGDLEAVVAPGLDGVVLPKVERAADLEIAAWAIANLASKQKIDPSTIELLPLIETARGLQNVAEIAASGVPSVRKLAFGAGDFTKDLGMTWSRSEWELLPARSQLLVASHAAGLEPPVDSVFIHIKDDDGFRASTTAIRDLGFQGKLCIHPNQVPIAHDVFTPDDAEVAWALRIVDAFRAAEAEGSASIQIDGYFVDYPIVAKAERSLAIARAAGKA